MLCPGLASIGFLDLPAGGCAGIPVLSAPKECQVSAHDDWDDFADLLPLMS